MNVINEYESEPALQEYSEYMKAAVDYSNDKTNTEYKEKYEQEKKKMIDSFRLMYPGDISLILQAIPISFRICSLQALKLTIHL